MASSIKESLEWVPQSRFYEDESIRYYYHRRFRLASKGNEGYNNKTIKKSCLSNSKNSGSDFRSSFEPSAKERVNLILNGDNPSQNPNQNHNNGGSSDASVFSRKRSNVIRSDELPPASYTPELAQKSSSNPTCNNLNAKKGDEGEGEGGQKGHRFSLQFSKHFPWTPVFRMSSVDHENGRKGCASRKDRRWLIPSLIEALERDWRCFERDLPRLCLPSPGAGNDLEKFPQFYHHTVKVIMHNHVKEMCLPYIQGFHQIALACAMIIDFQDIARAKTLFSDVSAMIIDSMLVYRRDSYVNSMLLSSNNEKHKDYNDGKHAAFSNHINVDNDPKFLVISPNYHSEATRLLVYQIQLCFMQEKRELFVEDEVLESIAGIICAKSMLLFSDACEPEIHAMIVETYLRMGDLWLKMLRLAILLSHLDRVCGIPTSYRGSQNHDSIMGFYSLYLDPFFYWYHLYTQPNITQNGIPKRIAVKDFKRINPDYKNLFSSFPAHVLTQRKELEIYVRSLYPLSHSNVYKATLFYIFLTVIILASGILQLDDFL